MSMETGNQAMTNDKQVEVWRKQFESLFDDNLLSRGNHGEYINDHRNSMWQGFLLAKRSMPPIEPPDADDYFDKFETNIYGYESAVHEAIAAAGYSYRVKE